MRVYIHCSLRLTEIKKVVQSISHFFPVLKSKVQSRVYKDLLKTHLSPELAVLTYQEVPQCLNEREVVLDLQGVRKGEGLTVTLYGNTPYWQSRKGYHTASCPLSQYRGCRVRVRMRQEEKEGSWHSRGRLAN